MASSHITFRRPHRSHAWAIWLLAGCLAALSAGPAASAEPAVFPGKVLLISGIFSFFSTGLDSLADELSACGYNAEVVPTGLAYHAVDQVCKQYASGQIHGPLVLIGHSLGGDMLPDLAQRLAAHHRHVDLLVPVDSTFPSDVPENVRRCVNLYQSNFSPTWFPIYRGAPVKAKNPRTELLNIDLRELPNREDFSQVNHFTIDETPQVHALIISEVARVMQAAVPTPPGRTTVHLPAVPGPPESIPVPSGRLPSNR